MKTMNPIRRVLIVSGLVQLLLAMVFPFYSPWAKAQEGIVMVHLIGIIQALLFIAFSYIWPKMILPRLTAWLSLILLYVAFASNWFGVVLVSIFGSGRAEFIVDQNLIPGDTGFWNTLTLLLLNASEFIIIPIIMAIFGISRKKLNPVLDNWLNGLTVVLTTAFTAFIIWQTVIPVLSNG